MSNRPEREIAAIETITDSIEFALDERESQGFALKPVCKNENKITVNYDYIVKRYLIDTAEWSMDLMFCCLFYRLLLSFVSNIETTKMTRDHH